MSVWREPAGSSGAHHWMNSMVMSSAQTKAEIMTRMRALNRIFLRLMGNSSLMNDGLVAKAHECCLQSGILNPFRGIVKKIFTKKSLSFVHFKSNYTLARIMP
jgi:hypothetical protein